MCRKLLLHEFFGNPVDWLFPKNLQSFAASFFMSQGDPQVSGSLLQKACLATFFEMSIFWGERDNKKEDKARQLFLSGLWRFLVVTAFFRNDHPQTNNFVNDVTNHRKSGFMIGIRTLYLLGEICAIKSRWRFVYFLERTFLKVFHLLESFPSFLLKKRKSFSSFAIKIGSQRISVSKNSIPFFQEKRY